MKRTHLRSKDVNKELARFNLNLSKKDLVELSEDQHTIILVNQQPAFFKYNTKFMPTLQYLQTHAMLKTISVDMGAIKFIIQGADIMRPGIIAIQEGIEKDEIIVVIDEKNKNPLAIGIALCGSAEMQKMKSGKAIKNIHYVGDELWKAVL